MHDIATLFPLVKECTYLNTAASGLLPKPVLDWRRDHDDQFYRQGGLFKASQGEVLTETREAVGRFFSCVPNRVALVPNFSYGMNTLVEGISPKDNRVLMLEGDYPSLQWPYTARGFDVSYVPITAAVEEEVASAFAKAQPHIFVFSIVQWLSGIKIDLHFIKKLKSRYPETIFVADGTQYLGTEPFDFDASGIDVLGASVYKWMNAGYGNALYLFKPEMAERLAPKTTGFNSLQGKYKPQEGNFIGRFEPGHQDTLNFGSLTQAIRLIEDRGQTTITATIDDLKQYAIESLGSRGLLDKRVLQRKEHSSIYNIPGDHTLFKKLEKERVYGALRGDGIRVSFHYYNEKQDIDRLLTVMK